MLFTDRSHAASLLAGRLATHRGHRPLVLAIPRGAVPMAKIVADALEGDLDVVLVHKLGAPDNPELAIGSIDEAGHVYLDPRAPFLPVYERYLYEEAQAQLGVLHRRRALYTPVRPSIDPAGRVVIVVDDGIATGSTMLAALRSLRARGPQRLIAATPVAARAAAERLRREADEVVCLTEPEDLLAIGCHYRDFRQITDEEVTRTLGSCAVQRPHPHALAV